MAADTDRRSSEVETPVLRVVTPDATPEEVAALVAVLASLNVDPAPARPRPRSWNHPRRLVRRTHRFGVGGWRASGQPS